MAGVVDRARRERTLIERLGARVPGFSGYLDRELRREVDELLRRHLAGRIDAARREVAVVMAGLTLQQAAQLRRLNRVDKELDALAGRLRAAGAGYSGLFDAVKVGEEQLKRLYEVDLSLVEDVETLATIAGGRHGEWESDLERLVERLRQAIEARPGVLQGLTHDGRGS